MCITRRKEIIKYIKEIPNETNWKEIGSPEPTKKELRRAFRFVKSYKGDLRKLTIYWDFDKIKINIQL